MKVTVEYTQGSGVNILLSTKRRLVDPETGAEVLIDSEKPIPIGINDFAADPFNPTDAEQAAAVEHIKSRLNELLVDQDAGVVAQAAVLTDSLRIKNAALDKEKQHAAELAGLLNAERESLEKERRRVMQIDDQLKAERQLRLKEKQSAAKLSASLSLESKTRLEEKRKTEQALLAERAERSKLAEQLEKVNAEKNQLLQSAQRQDDRGNAARG